MRPLLIPFALAFLAVPAAAQDWRMAPEYDVLLTTYDIQPGEVRLKAGEPVRLRFVNNTNQGLSFSAAGFFRDAKLRRRDSALVKGGRIEVPPLSTRTVVLVPKAGRYKATGANLLHRLLGMSGRIIVE
ncbi:MAG TPA: cupredoxin domain-containing protein [Allosphingosinicella sp.]|jgi:plastocyanin